jgi:hypothetical protein
VKVLLRDGKEVARGTERDCLKYIHDNHSFSVQHALAHEGYELKDAEEEDDE